TGPGATPARRATAALTARSGAVVEVRRVPQLRLRAVVRGVMARVERCGAELAALVHGVEIEAELGFAVGAEQPLLGQLHDPLEGLETGVGGLHAAPHELDREEPAAHLDVGLPPTGRARGPDVVVGVLTGADDRAVPHAARDLEGEPARRRHRREVALRR